MEALVTAGIDIGTSTVKAVVVTSRAGGDDATVLASTRERIHRRAPEKVAELAYQAALKVAGLEPGAVGYVASTGEADALSFRDGHFYGMTTHARGARFLMPGTYTVIDVGALYARVIISDEKSRVLRYRMTSQCAAGTGQFLENIGRYLGIRSEEIGGLSLGATRAESCSGICAVLAETDVINMVSRGVPTGEILRGIHDSIAQRLVKLVRALHADSPVALTGGLASDSGLVGAVQRGLEGDGGKALPVQAHALSAFAGAIGASLWAAHRFERLSRAGSLPRRGAA